MTPADVRHARGDDIIRAPRRLCLIATLVATLGLLAGTSAAAPGDGVEISGRSSGWVDIFVRELVTIPESEIKVSASGRYGGFYLVPDTATRNTVGALAIPSLGAGGQSGGRLFPLGPSYDVAPGTYRLFLIAEGATTVHVPIPNHAFQRLAPVGRSDSSMRLTEFVVPAAEQKAERRIGVHVRRPTLTMAAQVSSGGLTGVDHQLTCLTPAGTVCDRPPVRTTRAPFTSGRSSVAQLAKPAAYDMVYAIERGYGIHSDTSVKAAAFTLVL